MSSIGFYLRGDVRMDWIEEEAWISLGHEIESTAIAGPGIRTTYETTVFRVQRPGRGGKVVEVVCGHCDVVLGLRVLSVRRAAMRRRLWALLALVSLLVAAQLFYGLFLSDPSPFTAMDSAGPGTAAAVASPIGVCVSIIAFARSLTDSGIRIKTKTSRFPPHRLLH